MGNLTVYLLGHFVLILEAWNLLNWNVENLEYGLPAFICALVMALLKFSDIL